MIPGPLAVAEALAERTGQIVIADRRCRFDRRGQYANAGAQHGTKLNEAASLHRRRFLDPRRKVFFPLNRAASGASNNPATSNHRIAIDDRALRPATPKIRYSGATRGTRCGNGARCGGRRRRRGPTGGPNPHAVAGLAEVHRPRIVVDLGRNLTEVLVARKRVQDRRRLFHPGDQFRRQAVAREIEHANESASVGILCSSECGSCRARRTARSRAGHRGPPRTTRLHGRAYGPSTVVQQIVAHPQLGMIRHNKHQSHVFVVRRQFAVTSPANARSVRGRCRRRSRRSCGVRASDR